MRQDTSENTVRLPYPRCPSEVLIKKNSGTLNRERTNILKWARSTESLPSGSIRIAQASGKKHVRCEECLIVPSLVPVQTDKRPEKTRSAQRALLNYRLLRLWPAYFLLQRGNGKDHDFQYATTSGLGFEALKDNEDYVTQSNFHLLSWPTRQTSSGSSLPGRSTGLR